MNFFEIERFEMMSDAMDEIAEWLAYEADMESNPFDEKAPTETEMNEMFMVMG